jgi:REP element-mobilizing transposase RayT
VFSNSEAANIFCKHIRINEEKNQCLWLSWILMPDHFHGILRLGNSSLGQTISHLKGITSKRINENFNQQGSIWQPAYYERALRIEDDRKNIARYIILNPLRAGLVKNVREYPYWNSIWL